jgi:hypothetical protein
MSVIMGYLNEVQKINAWQWNRICYGGLQNAVSSSDCNYSTADSINK